MPRNLIDITDLSVEEINQLIATAEDIIANPVKYQDACAHKQLATLFFEPSTRTRLSFESAMLALGGSTLGFSEASSSSTAKGETVGDTIHTVSCYADIIAMRHPKEGAPYAASQFSEVPIINAGDGGHNHPTQTLTDLLTIHREKGRLNNFTIGFCGDLKFGRPLPGERPEPVRSHQLRADLPHRAEAAPVCEGGGSEEEGHPLHPDHGSGVRHPPAGHSLHDPCPEGAVLQ